MNILMTGASSFTGYWFTRQLAERGHKIFATFQGSRDSYSGLRKRRIDELPEEVVPVWNAPMLSTRLMNLVDEVGQWDLLCLHGAYVTGYRDPDFDFIRALKNNTDGLPALLERMVARGMKRAIATGTVYEANEGFGEEPLRAFSPYGLSKSLTWQVQQFCAQNLGIHLGKFVISIPFGPLEESRFTSDLIRTWHQGKAAEIQTPLYIRDHIHVSRLALHFADFAENLRGVAGTSRCAPMGYVESRGAFALRFAAEMRPRLGLECGVVLSDQKDFSEPFIRANTQMIDLPDGHWHESEAWDKLAAYYRQQDTAYEAL